jgi:lipoyl synthase
METPDQVMARGPRSFRSALISGGMNEGGWVPVEGHIEFLKLLRSWQWRLNFHVGLIPEESLAQLRGLASRISFDMVLDGMTIEEVYGLRATGKDYLRVYESLTMAHSVVPHITVGIHGGRLRGEMEIIDCLREHRPKEIVFLIFTPTKGTLYGDRRPPSSLDVERVFRYARESFPEASLSLGCMRPRGFQGYAYEKSALDCEFDTFVLPGREFRNQLCRENFTIEETRECCVL